MNVSLPHWKGMPEGRGQTRELCGQVHDAGRISLGPCVIEMRISWRLHVVLAQAFEKLSSWEGPGVPI